MNSRFIFFMRLIKGQVNKAFIVISFLSFMLFGQSVTAQDRTKINGKYQFNIPVQSLSLSLNKLSDIAKISFLFPYDLVEKKEGNSVQGRYTTQQALTILLRGTNLEGELSGKGAFLIKPLITHNNYNDSLGKEPMKSKKTLLATIFTLLFSTTNGAEELTALPDNTKKEKKSKIEVIEVTARKTVESIQEVPIAVAAFSSEGMEKLGVSDAGDIALNTPNFTWSTEFGKASPQPYLRGIGTNNFAPNNSRPVAVYQDNVFIGANVAQGFATFDLERVEVLKGPQGTLYGRNSTAGLINFISVKPVVGEDLNGHIKAEIGSFNTRKLEAAIGLPIGDDTAARFAFAVNKDDGSIKSINPDATRDAGRLDDIAARLQVVHETDDIEILFNSHYGASTPDTTPFKTIGLNCPEGIDKPTLGQCSTDFNGDGNTGLPNFIDSADIHETTHQDDFEDVKTWGSFLQVEWEIKANLTLTSLSAYDYAEMQRYDDLDESSLSIEFDHYNDEFNIYSQELRLSGTTGEHKWHVGAFYYDETYEGFLNFDSPYWEIGFGNTKKIETTSWAVFAQGDYVVNDAFSITAGLRYTKENKDIPYYDAYTTATPADQNSFYHSFTDQNIDNYEFQTTDIADDWSNVSGRLSFNYKVNEQFFTYFSVSRGFRGGDVNGVALAFEEETKPAAPETLDAIEFGWKSDLLEDSLRFNGAIFYYDYQDQQLVTVSENPEIPVGAATLQNVGESKIKGLELDVIWLATDNLMITASLGLLDAKFDDFIVDETTDENLAGNRIPFTNESSGNIAADYEIPFNDGSYVNLQLSANYQGDVYFEAFNNPILHEESLTLINAYASYVTSDEDWKFALVVKNLTDKEYFSSGFNLDFYGAHALKAGAQRYVGLTAKYSFY